LRSTAGRRLRAAVLLLAILVLSQTAVALAAAHPASAAAPAAPPLASALAFSPHYVILGQLDGSQLVQSQRPRSVPLAEGVQYAATYYTAKDLQNAYNVTGLVSQGYGGKGETIAVIDAYGDPTIQQDLASFDKEFGLPAASLTVIPVGNYEPANGITFGWDAETALDVEAAHAAAPYAHINLVVAENASNALFAAVKTVVDQRLGDVVSMSWGLGENSFGESGFSAAGYLNYAYLDYYFQKGAAEGVTFFASSGDYGAFDGTTMVTADFPATSPFVTGVGGTTLFLTGSGGHGPANSSAAYQGEAAWSVSPQYIGPQGVSSGGGYSAIFAQPYYQKGAIASGARSVPDVAADANPYTGFEIVLEGGTFAIGGTSLGAPFWAGMAADLDQYVGRDLGLLNPSLYSIYSDKAEYDGAFHQVTSGFNGEYQAGPGYNLVTGLGSPDLPNLAADIKNQSQGMSVSVTTSQSSASSAPAQYTYGEKFTITAAATTPTSGPVSSGTFYANIVGPGGQIATVPLSFDGLAWTGSYTPATGDPAGSWTVEVYGASGSSSGYGIADVSVGDSLAITGPVPYPYGPALAAGAPFNIDVVADSPSGDPIPFADLTAHLTYGGRTISDIPLNATGDGLYQGRVNITSSDPQGSYALVVDSPGVGSVYSYFYVGEAVTGVILTPLDGAIPSAAPGQLMILLAKTQTAAGNGIYTSNVTAKVYSLSGALAASVALQPSPRTVQFGVFNFFGYNQANFTIPSNLTQGFYKVQFLSSYQLNRSSTVQHGNFTTGFYVSAPTLSYVLSAPSTVYEGQSVRVQARITDSTGSRVDSGVFFATVVPSGYAFESYATDFLGYTGVPMQYNSSSGVWEGDYQIPSPLTPFNSFVGNLPALSAGPWTVFVTGESAQAATVVPSASYVDVLPYIYYDNMTLAPSNIAGAPLVVANGTGYLLSGIGRGTLYVTGVNLTLEDVNIGTLTISDANVRLVGSTVGTISASGSKLALLGGTQVGSLSMKSTSLTVSGSSYGSTASGLPVSDLLLYAVAAVAVVALAAALLAYRRKGPTQASASPQV
jgi:subtilase family serine protease